MSEADHANSNNAKVTLLVMLERFDEALATFKTAQLPAHACYFERAYAYYRLGKYQAAQEIIANAEQEPPHDPRLSTIKAQVVLFKSTIRYP